MSGQNYTGSTNPTIGRPTRWTEENRNAILEHIARGMPYSVACGLAHVSPRLFYEWVAQGKKDEEAGEDTLFAQFVQNVIDAEAIHKEGLLVAWEKQVKPADGTDGVADWRGIDALLKLRYAEMRETRRTTVEAEGGGTDPLRVTISQEVADAI